MCGRYSQTKSWSGLVEHFQIDDDVPALNLAPRYNIAPTQDVPVVRHQAGSSKRKIVLLRWGLVPSWAKEPGIGARMINARAETVAEKPSFRSAFKHRRCLIPADGFYEWKKEEAGPRQPYRITLKNRDPFAFAGLWERWEKAPDEIPVKTCTIITTEANDLLQPIHDRMPVILHREDYDKWLNAEANSGESVLPLLRPYPSEEMAFYPVSRHVNNVRNDDPQCVELKYHLK